MKDLILGCLVNYNSDQIKPWVNSINRSGFEGDKVILSFGIPQDTLQYLTDNGFEVYEVTPSDRHIVVDRFYAMWNFLTQNPNKYRYVITTDVKDVVFQYNPTDWLELNLKGRILVSSENIHYKNEVWGNNNLATSYPYLYDLHKDNTIYNAGTIAGIADTMRDFFLHIFNLSLVGADRQPDQAALNILTHTEPFNLVTHFASQEEGWCCQLGTTLDPKVAETYKPYLLEPLPIVQNDQVVNSKGEPFCLVHQYDRVPGLKEITIAKYS
jgi:hypothetical protein